MGGAQDTSFSDHISYTGSSCPSHSPQLVLSSRWLFSRKENCFLPNSWDTGRCRSWRFLTLPTVSCPLPSHFNRAFPLLIIILSKSFWRRKSLLTHAQRGFSFSFFFLFMATPMPHGRSQERDESKSQLWPMLQLWHTRSFNSLYWARDRTRPSAALQSDP